ncbi:MAG: entericidin A/B family lipoprotein [Vogesella sp.]|jgi:predicted small secreted protein|nr:putative small secreted protein [Vogesella perlucida]
MTIRLLALLSVVLAITGCNTVSGIGKDIKKAGSAIERAAQ